MLHCLCVAALGGVDGGSSKEREGCEGDGDRWGRGSVDVRSPPSVTTEAAMSFSIARLGAVGFASGTYAVGRPSESSDAGSVVVVLVIIVGLGAGS